MYFLSFLILFQIVPEKFPILGKKYEDKVTFEDILKAIRNEMIANKNLKQPSEGSEF
jgi:hypothetical protein